MESDFVTEQNFGRKNLIIISSRSWNNITSKRVKVYFLEMLRVEGRIIWWVPGSYEILSSL